MAQETVMQRKILANGDVMELVELRRDAAPRVPASVRYAVLWLDTRGTGRKDNVLDYRNFATYEKAKARYDRTA